MQQKKMFLHKLTLHYYKFKIKIFILLSLVLNGVLHFG